MLKIKHLRWLCVVFWALMAPPLKAADMASAIAAYQARDFDRAFPAFSALAAEGNSRAQAVLAIMYRYGEGVPADQRAAFDWYLKAARQDYVPAQYSVADMLIHGEGVPADRDEGMRWMQRAAEAGHERARAWLEASGPVSTPGEADETAWSRDWDLRLPNSIRFDPPASAPSFRVQLGENRQVNRLQAIWQQRQSEHPHALSRLRPSYLRDLTAETLTYQLQAGSYATEVQARALCESIAPAPCTVTYQ